MGCTLKPISANEFNAPPKMRYNWHGGNSGSQKKDTSVRGSLDSKAVTVSSGVAFERGFRRAKQDEKLAFLQSVPLEKYRNSSRWSSTRICSPLFWKSPRAT